MSTQRGIHLSVPWELHARVEAFGGAQRPLLPNHVGTVIVAGCVTTDRRLQQRVRLTCQDNSA